MPRVDLTIKHFPNAKKHNPRKNFTNTDLIAKAVFECLLENDPNGAMDMIMIYLEAVNKTDVLEKGDLHKSTYYSALKHKNPTIKTLAKIMSSVGK